MLSAIASGDQILCGILDGTKEIDAFDISRFLKYFLYLKIAGIQVLSKEEYIDFFYEDEYSFQKITNSDSGVMIYRNK